MNKVSNCAESVRQRFDESKELLKLTDSQEFAAEKMLDVISRWGFVFNTSELGAGKSYMCLDVANRLDNKNIFIICPVSVTATWENMGKRYITKPFKIITYDKFRGSEKHDNSLFVHFSKNGGFVPKKYLNECLATGTTFIFDECHKLKNDSLQKNVTSFILEYARKKSDKTKAIFSSGTLTDNQESARNFFDLIGIKKGYALEKCTLFDPEAVKTIDQGSEFALFKGVILKNMSVFCPVQKRDVNTFNHFFDLREAVSDFELLVKKLDTYTSKKFDAKTRDDFIKDCMMIELLKVGIFVEEAKNAIFEGCKVVLIFNFSNSLGRCVEALQDYHPLVFEGSTPVKKRKEYLELFQNDSSGRSLIIGNIQVLAEGIDLDDKTGIYKRKVFASPNYSAIRTHQLTNRFSRLDTLSRADVCWVYATQGKHEKNIIEALRQKHEIISHINDHETKIDGVN